MKNTLVLLGLVGGSFLVIAALIGHVLELEKGDQVYKLLAIIYLSLPGVIAYLKSRREGVSLSIKNTHYGMLILSIALPFVVLVSAMILTFLFSLDEAKDAFLIAPMHGLTVKHKVLQLAIFGSNMALLTLFYGLTLQLIIAFGEEVMWRGYFLHQLKKYSFFVQASLTGIAAGLWQVPLILLFGWFYPEHTILGPLWMIVLSLLLSPILLYLRRVSGSLLPPTLFHAFFYAMASLLPFIMSEPNYILGGMTGVAGFLSLVGINILFIPFFKKERRIFLEENT